uniref:Putative tigger transposable element-derived n=1 Tax=Lutzomyia longipalpis TaxID=7200 RepID=A0A1B0CMK5_LUTLO
MTISLLMCGTTSGDLLPPFVVYKSAQLWSSWCQGGPPHCRYGNSPSGWFDGTVFREWVESILIPDLRRKEGKKIILCDNLSTHVTLEVISMLEKCDAKLICLPSNSTHVTQPLDVAFFGPLKIAWRELLLKFKESASSGNSGIMQKNHFPALLKSLMEKISPNSSANLRSGFRKCGIVPVDARPILQRLRLDNPIDDETSNAIHSSFLQKLDEKRTEWVGIPKKGKRKKLNIVPGKSVCEEDFVKEENQKPQKIKSQRSTSGEALKRKPPQPSTSGKAPKNKPVQPSTGEAPKRKPLQPSTGEAPTSEAPQPSTGEAPKSEAPQPSTSGEAPKRKPPQPSTGEAPKRKQPSRKRGNEEETTTSNKRSKDKC